MNDIPCFGGKISHNIIRSQQAGASLISPPWGMSYLPFCLSYSVESNSLLVAGTLWAPPWTPQDWITTLPFPNTIFNFLEAKLPAHNHGQIIVKNLADWWFTEKWLHAYASTLLILPGSCNGLCRRRSAKPPLVPNGRRHLLLLYVRPLLPLFVSPLLFWRLASGIRNSFPLIAIA